MSASAGARRRVQAATIAAVTKIGEDLLGEAQRRAPLEEGTLRASGELDVDVAGNAVVATVSFNEVYAARQHEETEWVHPKAGEAKYLEGPLRERAARYDAVVAAAIRRAL